MLLGDFNAILDSSEVSGDGVDHGQSCYEFQQCLLEAGVATMLMKGAMFSWHNKRYGASSIWKRLDRILVNEHWMAKWPDHYYLCSTPRTSDHSPLILCSEAAETSAKRLFRFDNFLADSPVFLQRVHSIWRHHIEGTRMYAVVKKLKLLKPIFREMRRSKGDLHDNVAAAAVFLAEAQSLQQQYLHNEDLSLLERCCRLIYLKAVQQEQSFLRQRAKLTWLKEGDMCSRVFFRKVKARRAIFKVYQIHSQDGVLLTDRQDISHEFVSFYERLLGGEQSASPISLGYLTPYLKHQLRPDEADRLVAPITESDIKLALFSIPDDKASGPDGYSSCFFKRAWPVIGPEVTLAIQEFFSSGRLLKQVNATLLCLIPKVQLPSGVTDFRPISCCNILYKLITKILVSRLALILDKLVHVNQTAFVPNRQISDNILLVQELFAGYNQKKFPPCCAMKVDLRKAFDSVNWGFLQAALMLFNFPPQFMQWITECVTTPSFSLSLNGGICGFFKGARGLRQGDPLSPYLFVIVMEVLNVSMTARIQQDQCFSYHWRCKELSLAMLCFADDLLLFSKADPHSVSILKEVLDGFGIVSGLVANAAKSHVILSRAAMALAPTILTITGFQLGSLPFRYLGLPIVSSKLTIADCQPLLSKVDERISGWGSYQLSFAARTQLIRSVLCSLSIYWSSSFLLPKGIITVLEKKLRRFLWQGTTGAGFAKVSWHAVCLPKDCGGLGIPNLLALNQSLMCKHLWDILTQNMNSIWVQWVFQYRLHSRSLWDVAASGHWSWKRPVAPFRCIRAKFPRAPMVTGLPKTSKLSKVISEGNWNWPSPTSTEVMAIMEQLPPIHVGEDRILWSNSSGVFSTSSAYKLFTTETNKVKFLWPHLDWDRGLQWAQSHFRGRHLITAAHRATLASLVYHIWRERNQRRFVGTATTPVEVAHMVENQVRLRIQSENLSPTNVQTSVLFRIWNIAV
ncbi:UNVERIFIED_CONTAM: Retrovirus-related Pol polyprotein from type-2 retrotransposable element R2DM [Sesamum radiatum]|uniref:Retrovirus-related Pol polyprotein from type-2 retrotransposable element R2DM n=1 Tax=Sesamum radiatum TaxID=300843 RepID=A0AAW2L350_SESRA